MALPVRSDRRYGRQKTIQSGCLTSGTKRQIFTTSSTMIFSENRFPVFADADLRFVIMAYSSHSVMKLPFSWMSVVSNGPGPRLVNFLRRVRRHDQYLASRRLDLPVTDGEQPGAGADDENLAIGMGVQPRAAADLRQIVEDQAAFGAIGAALQLALPMVGRSVGRPGPFVAVDDMRHGPRIDRRRVSCRGKRRRRFCRCFPVVSPSSLPCGPTPNCVPATICPCAFTRLDKNRLHA